jgi:hypothetical protein
MMLVWDVDNVVFVSIGAVLGFLRIISKIARLVHNDFSTNSGGHDERHTFFTKAESMTLYFMSIYVFI